jgi:hypothetical protein
LAIPGYLRDWEILESDYMYQRHSRYLIVDGWIVLRGGTNHNVTLSDKYQIRVVNVIAQALANDDSDGLKRLLTKPSLDIFGSIHLFLSLVARLSLAAGAQPEKLEMKCGCRNDSSNSLLRGWSDRNE